MRVRKTFVATAAILTLIGSVPAASAATTPRTAQGTAAGVAPDLVLPAATLSRTRLTVRWDGRVFILTASWKIHYTAKNIEDQTTYQTWADIWELDDSQNDLLAQGGGKAVALKPRVQDHNVTQTFTMNRAAINTEIGDEEVFAKAWVFNTKTQEMLKLPSLSVSVDD
ncbi:hypothetical protein [Streptomyces sp. NPDC096311]|uniref:hypothetical protein n=1 Tax=Streptomyces sp. NPDC096311 TaxID=3366083 RepID=UPI00380B8F3C